MLLSLLILHAVCGGVALAAGRHLGRYVWLVGVVAPAVTVLWLGANSSRVTSVNGVVARTDWVPSLGLALDLRLDAFSALMVVLISGIGALVYVYGWQYFGQSHRGGLAAGLLTLFAGSMLGVVVADNLFVLYLFWELTSITSYLLIGLDDDDPEARSAAQHALLVTGFGGLVMLAGFVVLGQQAGTFRISELLAAPPSGSATTVALVLILIGAFTKSAQYPFHSWLPGAMVAPTPISAYLHSAAMVKAGVYLVARLAPVFGGEPVWRPLVVSVGLITMVIGGLRALLPADLKQLLALGTISQLGFLVVLFGIGRPEATAAGCVLILAHGLFKAALFMVVGIVDHETQTRNIDQLPLLGRGWGPTRAVGVASAASMAAVPPLAGFVAKEEAYGALVDGGVGDRVVLAGIVIGSVLTVAYSIRFGCALVRPDAVSGRRSARAGTDHAPGRWFVLPGVVLALGSIVLGLAPALWSDLVDRAANALDPAASAHLELWHGFSAPLALSVVTLAGGAMLFALRRVVSGVQERMTFPVGGGRVYEALVGATLGLAARVTSVVQSGSLPIYAAVVLSTAAVAPVVAMVGGRWWSGWPEIIGRPAHVPIAAILLAGCVAATLARRRFAAAILLGVVGYGMALFFVVQGAPDLALTQFAIETLSIVAFLLVFRVLPDRFERGAPAVRRSARLAVSVTVGVFVMLMAIVASGWRTEPSVSREMSERALPDGDGRNVVNVILVDIRGLDTMGEITVLATAGIGIVALARAGRAPRGPGAARQRRRPADQEEVVAT